LIVASRRLRGWVVASASILAAAAVHAAPDSGVVDTASVDCTIVLDGRDDEDCWRQAPSQVLAHERSPQPGRAPAVETRYRVVHDQHNLYVLVECIDSDPTRLSYVWSRRDKVGTDQDSVTLYIDPIGKRAFAQMFRVNPVGSVSDGTYSEASLTESTDQDFDFSVATRISEHGWSAEFRIPFRSLRYGDGAGAWTLLVSRNYPREQRYVFTSTPLTENSDCFLCRNPALGGLTPPADTSFVAAAPYALVRSSRHRDDTGRDNQTDTRAGVDLKARIGASTFIDATLNPDFSQVELDAPQLAANARFGIFFAEKRPFFLEGADLLDTPLTLIHTRTIADPRAGVRVTQRSDQAELLAIVAQDRGGAAIMYPGSFSTYPIVRDSRADILLARGRLSLTPGASAGTTVSLRDSADGERNTVVGADLAWQINDSHKLRLQAAGSDTRGDARARAEGAAQVDPGRGNAFFIDHSFYGEHVDSLLTLERVDAAFRSENGFIRQAGYTRAAADLDYRFGRIGWFHEVKPYLSLEENRAMDGGVVSRSVHPALQLLGPGTGLLAEAHLDEARADKGLPLHPLRQLLLSAKLLPGPVLTLAQLDLEFGRRLDYANDIVGPGLRAYAEMRWRVGRRVEMSLSSSHEQIDSGGLRLLTDTNGQYVATCALSSTSWVRLILQAARTFQADIALPGSGDTRRREVASLVYVVAPWRRLSLSVGLTADRRLNNASRTSADEVFVKALWPFGFGS